MNEITFEKLYEQNEPPEWTEMFQPSKYFDKYDKNTKQYTSYFGEKMKEFLKNNPNVTPNMTDLDFQHEAIRLEKEMLDEQQQWEKDLRAEYKKNPQDPKYRGMDEHTFIENAKSFVFPTSPGEAGSIPSDQFIKQTWVDEHGSLDGYHANQAIKAGAITAAFAGSLAVASGFGGAAITKFGGMIVQKLLPWFGRKLIGLLTGLGLAVAGLVWNIIKEFLKTVVEEVLHALGFNKMIDEYEMSQQNIDLMIQYDLNNILLQAKQQDTPYSQRIVSGLSPFKNMIKQQLHFKNEKREFEDLDDSLEDDKISDLEKTQESILREAGFIDAAGGLIDKGIEMIPFVGDIYKGGKAVVNTANRFLQSGHIPELYKQKKQKNVDFLVPDMVLAFQLQTIMSMINLTKTDYGKKMISIVTSLITSRPSQVKNQQAQQQQPQRQQQPMQRQQAPVRESELFESIYELKKLA